MPVQEQLNIIFQLLQAGRSIPIEEVIEVVPDVAGTGLVAQGSSEVAILGNGTAAEVTTLVVDSTATEVSTAGVGLLAVDVGVVGAAIAPALGILAGIGLYNLAPEFWTNVSNKLVEAGQTIGGKVRMFINGDAKQVGVSEETLEIFKQAFIEAGLFEESVDTPIEYVEDVPTDYSQYLTMPLKLNGEVVRASDNTLEFPRFYRNNSSPVYSMTIYLGETMISQYMRRTYIRKYLFSLGTFQISADNTTWYNVTSSFTLGSLQIYYDVISSSIADDIRNPSHAYKGLYETTLPRPLPSDINETTLCQWILWLVLNSNIISNTQEGAILPNENPIPEIYPAWNPWSVPVEGFPDVYPIEIPAINPNPDQQQAQFPQEIPDNDPNALEWLIETLPQPDPNPNPYPEPVPNPDPDPAPEPEPMPEPEPEPTPNNPVDPNPTPDPSPLPVVPDMPDTVESNAMFTVYKPSMSQVNAFGGWLWSSSIVEAIKRIWQNPLDGIISFMKVYANAPTSGSDTIKVGILDSEVSAPIVSGQFVTVECGSLNVREKFYNATDYSPFVAMHLYLPFIGIVELDIDEFMSGEIKVTYHVDIYTGTCLAEVKSRRSPDMPEWTIVYTFSGNASQQLPLTSAEFSGALSSLVGVVGGGLAIASGGGLGLLAGASGIAHAVSHEMVHLAHSGSLSANAGIMGSRKPYLILTRRRSYDANGYNTLYGYPSNKTVYLNNCSGYVKVKDIRLETVATDSERIEIESLLKAGVII